MGEKRDTNQHEGNIRFWNCKLHDKSKLTKGKIIDVRLQCAYPQFEVSKKFNLVNISEENLLCNALKMLACTKKMLETDILTHGKCLLC